MRYGKLVSLSFEFVTRLNVPSPFPSLPLMPAALEKKAERIRSMSTIEIQRISIAELDTDAVVYAANEELREDGDVCRAIFRAAGHDKLEEACRKIGHCDTGSAVITPGFDLKVKYIIHVVGPRWKDGKHGELELLYRAYYRALELAVENGCESIGFPFTIAGGIFNNPVEQAFMKASEACQDFQDRYPEKTLDIYFVVLEDETMESGHEAIMNSKDARYRIAERDDWQTQEMPEKRDSFILRRHFTPEQMATLHRGNIPRGMEDKWFWYMEGDTLFAHRSWTGFCIYQVKFEPDDNHIVTVNRDLEQYRNGCTPEDTRQLNKLLDWWTKEQYDCYHEWLDETVDALKRAGKTQD